MSAKYAVYYWFDGVRRRHRWLQILVLTLLMAAPMKVLAASLWCSWFPWWFGCQDPATGCGTGLTEVSGCGSNPGNLKMCTYVPDDLEASRPLVVALHGCTQQASDYDDETGWVKLADKHKFALLLPQQQQANNATKCFNWFEQGDIERDQGEALSIRQMIDKMIADEAADSENVYVTGLSAGGGSRFMLTR